MNSKGSIAITFVVCLAIAATSFSFYFLQEKMVDTQQFADLSSKKNIDTHLDSLLAVIHNPYVLTTILNDPANVTLRNCLTQASVTNCPKTEQPLSIPLPSYDLAAPNAGLLAADTTLANGFGVRWDAANGFRCNGFSVSGNNNCPLRYDMTWGAICAPVGPCFNPRIFIRGKLRYSTDASRMLILNTENFDLYEVIN